MKTIGALVKGGGSRVRLRFERILTAVDNYETRIRCLSFIFHAITSWPNAA
jgi:hypothetical protein